MTRKTAWFQYKQTTEELKKNAVCGGKNAAALPTSPLRQFASITNELSI